MRHNVLFMALLLNLASVSAFAQSKTHLEIKDGWYNVNGEKFFIKAIGYEIGARPGQNPYQGAKVEDLDLLKFDLKVIKEGGYNTIRTWSQLSESQLNYGIRN